MTFTQKDFASLRNFQKRMEQEFGTTAYTGTDYATILVDYSTELKDMIRPMSGVQHLNFVLKVLGCRSCKTTKQAFLCLEEQDDFLCDTCLGKKKKVNFENKETLRETNLKLPEVKPE